MVALSGQPNDMRATRKAAEGGSSDAALALEVFTRSVRKAIGAFAWLMGRAGRGGLHRRHRRARW